MYAPDHISLEKRASGLLFWSVTNRIQIQIRILEYVSKSDAQLYIIFILYSALPPPLLFYISTISVYISFMYNSHGSVYIFGELYSKSNSDSD